MNKKENNILSGRSIRRLLALCGVIGPILFVSVIFIFGLLRPSYDPLRQHISELGEVNAPNAIIFSILAFFVLGILMIGFACGLQQGIDKKSGSKLGPILIAISGIGWMGAAFFQCDPGAINTSFTGKMHDLTAIIALFGMVFAPFIISKRLKGDIRWEKYQSFSIVIGAVAIILTGVMMTTAFSPVLLPLRGFLQRLAFYTPLLWMEVLAIRLLTLS